MGWKIGAITGWAVALAIFTYTLMFPLAQMAIVHSNQIAQLSKANQEIVQWINSQGKKDATANK